MTDAARPAARFLVAMFQGGGNIPLIVPVLSRLVARGHAVRVIAGPGVRPSRLPVSVEMRERIAGTGARIVEFVMPEIHPLDAAPPVTGVDRLALPEGVRAHVLQQTVTAAWYAAWADNVTAALRREAADAVVADFVLLGALTGAEAAGVPSAALVHNATVALVHTACRRPVAPMPPAGSGLPPGTDADGAAEARIRAAVRRAHDRNARRTLNGVRERLGLPPLSAHCDQLDAARRVLILASRAFDFPSARLPANVRYTGTPIDDAGAPAWQSPWPADDPRPLVLVSLSTLNQGQGELMQRTLSALGRLPVRAIATLGPALASRPFEAPANVHLTAFVPHSAVLPQVGAMVTQCGLGTMTKALAHGVPLVCLPILGDQPDNAARVVYHGAGVRLAPDATGAEIAAAVERVLAEPAFTDAARRLAAEIVPSGAEERAAVELEAVVAQPPAARSRRRSPANGTSRRPPSRSSTA